MWYIYVLSRALSTYTAPMNALIILCYPLYQRPSDRLQLNPNPTLPCHILYAYLINLELRTFAIWDIWTIYANYLVNHFCLSAIHRNKIQQCSGNPWSTIALQRRYLVDVGIYFLTIVLVLQLYNNQSCCNLSRYPFVKHSYVFKIV